MLTWKDLQDTFREKSKMQNSEQYDAFCAKVGRLFLCAYWYIKKLWDQTHNGGGGADENQ